MHYFIFIYGVATLASLTATPAFASKEIKNTTAPFTADDFRDYVQTYQTPELFQQNGDAFAARMKLLDRAPAGSTAKILTFVFDNGEVVRRLGTHACLAAKRGVKVELIVDSKSGDRVGLKDAFDKSIGNRVNEENYQYMANCGVKVVVHNHLKEFNTLLGKAIPKVSEYENAVAVVHNLRKLANDFVEILREEMKSEEFQKIKKERFGDLNPESKIIEEIKTDVYRILAAAVVTRATADEHVSLLEKAAKAVAKHTPGLRDDKVTEILDDPKRAGALFDEALISLNGKLAKIPVDGADPDKLEALLGSLKKRYAGNEGLVRLYENIRRFNRLNHRKLFLVENPDGKEGCAFVGGRNLGDHYLADHHDSFMDGDVLYCRHHGAASGDILAEAKASFEELKHSTHDRVLGKEKDAEFRVVEPKKGFRFQELVVPPVIMDPLSNPRQGLTYNPKELPAGDRGMLYPMVWKDPKPVHGLALPEARNWKFHRVAWEPKLEADAVRQALLKAIGSETKEIYIETAYAEFDETMQKAIVAALERGVNVRLITNGLFITDGPSKAIRFFMGLSMKELQEKYAGQEKGKGRFDLRFATLEGGHMIHFKGAHFNCVKNAKGEYVKTSLIGSHNFHPRSGYSDKEHALQWEQPADDNCLVAHGKEPKGYDTPDLEKYRDGFYAEMQAKLDAKLARVSAQVERGPAGVAAQVECRDDNGEMIRLNVSDLLRSLRKEEKSAGYRGQILAQYPRIHDELRHVLETPTANDGQKRRAKALMRALYNEKGELREQKLEMLLLFLREGGVRDSMGLVL